MKIIVKENIKNNFTDKNVRWYLADGNIWIGLEKTYEEIEESKRMCEYMCDKAEEDDE